MFTVILDANNKVIHDPSQNDSGLLVVGGVINKQVNCADSFTFTIYPDNVGYSDIEIMTTWLSVLKDGEVVFHGRVLAEKTGWNNEKEITCEGDLAILNDSILRPYSFSGTLSDYMIMLINQHNAQVGADKQIVIKTVDNPTTQMIRRTADYKPTLQELFEKIVDYFGGYLVIEIENGVRKISYVTDSTSGTNQTLEIGKNIIDFNRTIAAEALATAIIPLGATNEETGQRLTIETVNDGSDFLASPDAATKGLIYAVYTFDGITDPAELKAKGQAVLADLTRIVPRIELSAVDLSSAGYDIDAIGFFQYVTVQDNAHTVSGQYLITERTYNISAPEQDKITFGGQEKTISGQSAKTQIDLSSVEDNIINKTVDIVQYQTDLLKGASGGFFVIGTNSEGKPSETYWMDTDSTATARKVLRINYNGIGFSANGISGPYDTAWTLDGNFNAKFIRVGIIQDAAGKNSWNLDTGLLSITDGKIVATFTRTFSHSDYDNSDLTAIQALVTSGVWTDEDLEKYDINLDGQITSSDLVKVRNMILNGTDETASIKTEIDPSNTSRPIAIYIGSTLKASISPSNVYAQSGTFEKKVFGGNSWLGGNGVLELNGSSGRVYAQAGDGITFYDTSNAQTGRIGSDCKDYIKEQGTASGWSYRKWNSGIYECWRTISTSPNINNAWVNQYYGVISAINYPVTFSAKPDEVATLGTTQDFWGMLSPNGDNTNSVSRSYAIVRPNTSTNTRYSITYYVKGTI